VTLGAESPLIRGASESAVVRFLGDDSTFSVAPEILDQKSLKRVGLSAVERGVGARQMPARGFFRIWTILAIRDRVDAEATGHPRRGPMIMLRRLRD
jgi:hypothetical protein